MVNLGNTLSVLIAGVEVVALVLGLPTAGPRFVDALMHKDMFLVGALITLTSLILILANLLADVLLAWLDPRTIQFDSGHRRRGGR
ncbi:MAG: hypothetical protein ACR2F6_18375 [Mycobacteriales bacterium]